MTRTRGMLASPLAFGAGSVSTLSHCAGVIGVLPLHSHTRNASAARSFCQVLSTTNPDKSRQASRAADRQRDCGSQFRTREEVTMTTLIAMVAAALVAAAPLQTAQE